MTFNFQPTLSGERIRLRPLLAADFPDLYKVASDPLIWEQHPAKNRYEEAAFKQFFEDSLRSGGALIAIDAENQQVIGSSRYHGYSEESSEIEIGWTFLARSHWGGRYNGEMKKLMMQHAFQFVEHIVLLVGHDNLRSQGAVRKIGGVAVGSRVDSSGNESIVFQISASSFAK